MLHSNRPFNYSSARRHWRYAEWRCGSETYHAGEIRRPASAGFEEVLVLQWIQPDSPDVLSVIVVRNFFVAVVCWTTAVETEDAQRLVKKSRGCCWLTASHPGGGGGTEDAAENADYHGQHLPPPPRIPNTPRSSFNDLFKDANQEPFPSCCHQDHSC